MREKIFPPLLLVCLFVLAVPPGLAMDFNAGDLDGDGYLTVDDLRTLGTERSTLAGAYRGDVDGNGRIDDGDLQALARILLSGSGRKVEDRAVVDDFIRFAVSREATTGRGDIRGGTDTFGDENEGSRVARDLERNREQLQVNRLRKIYERFQPRPAPPTASIDGRPQPPGLSGSAGRTDTTSRSRVRRGPGGGGYGGGISGPGANPSGRSGSGGTRSYGGTSGGRSVLDLNSAGQGRGRGKAPELSRDSIQRTVSRIDAVVDLDGVLNRGRLDVSVKAINAHRNRGLSTAASAKLEQLFSSAQGKNRDVIEPSEHPDPGMIRQQGPSHDRTMLVGRVRRDEARGTFYPRSSFDLQVEKNQPEAPGIATRVGATQQKSLEEVYRPVAPTEREAERPSIQLEEDVRRLSDDPYMSQILKGVNNPEDFIASVGGDARSGPKSRGETLAAIFQPDAARTILSGGASSYGLDPASTFVQRYVPIADEVIPTLVENGTISQGEADDMIRQIHNIQGTQAGGDNRSGLDGFLDALSGLGGGDPFGGMQPGDIASTGGTGLGGTPAGTTLADAGAKAVGTASKTLDKTKIADTATKDVTKKDSSLLGSIGKGMVDGLKLVAPIAPISPIALAGGLTGGAAKGAYDYYKDKTKEE